MDKQNKTVGTLFPQGKEESENKRRKMYSFHCVYDIEFHRKSGNPKIVCGKLLN